MTTNDRTGLDELDAAECWRLLETRSVGRLAVAIANKPDLFVVNYQVTDGPSIVVKTAPGLKLAAATLGVGIAFEVDALDESNHAGWSVVVQGTATEIERADERAEAEALEIETWARGSKGRYLRITADTVSGRRLP